MPTLAEIYGTNNTAKGTTQSSLAVNNSLGQEKEKNKFLKGLGYLGEKNIAAFVNSLENAWDYQASGIAKLFGADDWAEKQVATDWFGDWYSHPDEWFKADKGWKVAGDVSSGIGSSGPSVALSFIPYAGPIVSVIHAAMAGAGNALKESYQETGELGGKQYLYGGLAGGVEGVIEYASNKLGIGSVGAIKSIGKSATKSIASRVGVAAAEGFLGEAFEEGVTELVNPYLKQITYDKNAENATASEVLYAALVGGLSGAFMGGGGATVDVASSIASGTNAVNNGRTAEIMEYGKFATAFEDAQQTKNEYYDRVASSYKALKTSLEKTGGEVTTANQRMMLGDLARANVKSVIAPMIYREAANILDDPEAYVARFNENKYTDADGSTLSITVEALTKGYDANNPKSIAEAIKTNATLRTLSAMVVSGKIMSDTSAMTDSILKGESLKSKVDLVSLAERADANEIEALSEALGIEDWSEITLDEFNNKLEVYRQSGGIEKYAERTQLVNKLKQIEKPKAKFIPKGITELKGGQARYTDGTLDIGIIKNGEQYLLYDFNSGLTTKMLSKDELNTYLSNYSKEQYAEAEAKRKEASAKRKAEVEELDAWARENIEDYATLSAPNKTMIRKVIRDARANGLSEADVRSYAIVAAHSGLDIEFNESKCVKGGKVYAGYYDPNGNKIVVNPKAKKKHSALLMHELSHAVRAFKGIDNKIHYIPDTEAVMKVSDETWNAIETAYADQDIDVSRAELIADEASAWYAEEMLGKDGVVDLLMGKKPSLKNKILNFFKGASKDYEGDVKLSREAKKQYKSFKQMFDAFSALNQGANAYGGVNAESGGKRYSFAGENAKTANVRTLVKAKEMLKKGIDSETVRKETRWFKGYDGKWRFEIDDSDISIDNRKLQKHEAEYTLDEVVSHKALFEAYPELAKTKVVVQYGGLVKGAVGAYIADKDTFVINSAIWLKDEDMKKVLVHEMQHKIQRIEGFARGSSPEYWAKRGISEAEYNDFVAKTEMELAKAKRGLSESDKEKLNEYYALGKQQDKLYSKLDFKNIFDEEKNAEMQKIIDQIAPIEKRHDELYDYLYYQPWFARINELYYQTEVGEKLNTVFYKNTAGEIEARNAAERINLTAEERKNTRPDIDRADVVFAESVDKNLTIEIAENGNPVVVVRDDITKYASNDKELIRLVKKSIGKLPYVALGKQKIKFTQDTKSEVTFSKYTRWIRANAQNVYKDKMRLFNHPSEIILATTNYINEGLSHPRTDNIADFARGEVLVDVIGTQYSAEVVIGFTKSGECELHDVVKMTPASFKYKTRDALSVISLSSEHPQKRLSLDNIIPQSTEKSTPSAKKVEEGLSKDSRGSLDTDYLSAVENGDEKTQERIIVEAAKKAGYKYHLYHGTNAYFTEFDLRKFGGRNGKGEGYGIYLAANREISAPYGKYVIDSYVKFNRLAEGRKKTLTFAEVKKLVKQSCEVEAKRAVEDGEYDSKTEALRDTWVSNYVNTYQYSSMAQIYEDVAQMLWRDNDNDGDLINEVMTSSGAHYDYNNALSFYENILTPATGIDGFHYVWGNKDGSGVQNDIYLAFKSEQIKSADLITYDDNGNIILPSERFNTESKDIRYSLDLGIETKALTEMPDKYKASVKEKISNAWTSVQISLTNEQAGIEKIGKKLGIKDIEARVQAVRASRNMAEMMLGDEQYRIGASGKEIVKQGEGLGKIFSHIKAEDEELFNTYLLHWHNTSRMTLAEKSQAQIDAAQKDFDTKAAELVKANKALNKLVKQKEGVEPRSAEAKAVNKKIADARAKVIEARKAANESKKALDSLTLEENKPIFAKSDGSFVTAEESKKIIAEIEKEHPDFKGVAEKVWAYSRNLNQYRVDTGLISQEEFDYLNEKYPYYVPTYRDGGAKGIVPITGSHDLAVKQTVKTAKGSGLDVLPIKAIMARQTMETVRAGQTNKLVKELYDARGNEEYIAEVSRKKNDDLEVNPTEQRPKDNQITFYDNGDKVTLSVSKEIFQGFEGFKGTALSDTDAFKAMNWANKGFKALVTSYSPAFMIRNPIRDIQDAGIYSKYGLTFAKNYARVGKLIAENSVEWQMYRAMGGLSSSLFDMDKGTKNSLNKWGLTKEEGNILKKGLGAIENANVFLEQLPRFAEFLSSIEAGNTYEQAILDAADVTTNFGRTGKITKVLNATIIPFLNPSIQGFSKMIRTVTSVKTAREAGALFMKAAMLGIAPMVLNMLMYGDDEDYEDLRENDKENNFLIKIGDTFIKLPRGRVASALGGLVNRGVKTAKGEDADWKGYIENVSQQVTPVDSMSRTILSPLLRDLPTNTTWYGTEIEGREFENVAPRDRYDESTSEIAKAIGKVFNYSPKKIHYLIDQYSGVIGDFILPLTSKKAEKDFFSGNFTIDPATSNKLSSSFYKKYEEAQYAKSAGDDVAKYQVRYLNSVKSAVSELYKEKSAIQNSDLSSVDKLQQTRTIQILINEAFKTAMKDYDLYTKAFESTSAIEDENMRYVESMRLTQGAEKALEVYDEKVYEKYSLINKSGIDYDVLYYYYFVQKDIESDKDKNGNTIAGSKKEKALKLVNSLKIDKNQKLLLLAASGYSVGDRNTKLKLARYITSLKATKEEKAALAEMCGFKVKNGTILMSSIK